jgi:hypothetical protein
MTTNRPVPIVVISSENIPNKIRNIDDIEYELSQNFVPLSRLNKNSRIKFQSFIFIRINTITKK